MVAPPNRDAIQRAQVRAVVRQALPEFGEALDPILRKLAKHGELPTLHRLNGIANSLGGHGRAPAARLDALKKELVRLQGKLKPEERERELYALLLKHIYIERKADELWAEVMSELKPPLAEYQRWGEELDLLRADLAVGVLLRLVRGRTVRRALEAKNGDLRWQ